MPAQIDSMMSAGGMTPWHGLGTVIPEDALTASEAIQAAGLTWRVAKEEIYTMDGIPVPGKYAIIREDNRKVMGVVGSVYNPLQNDAAFRVFDEMVGSGDAKYVTAGALSEGRKVWLLAKLPGTIRVTSEDTVDKFLLLTHSHDGSMSVQMFFTPIRVVCQNTLNVALDQSRGSVKASAKHTATTELRLTNMRTALGLANNMYEQFGEAASSMLRKNITSSHVSGMLRAIGYDDGASDNSPRDIAAMDTIRNLVENGRGNSAQGVRGSGWALFNGVTEWVDYCRDTRGGASPEEQRAKSLLFASGRDIKQKAFNYVMAI